MRSDLSSQIIKNKRSQRPKTYFQLIDRVGSDGSYQLKMLVIFSLIWLFTGMILINTNFLFYNKNFQCQQMGLLTSSCQETVCELSPKERIKYIKKQKSLFKSMATQLGQYYCEDEVYINLTKLCVYVGSLVGFVIFSYFSDNFGRKKSLYISLTVCVIGNVIVSISPNLLVASIGLFLSGTGANTSLNTTIFFFNEILSNVRRQKYSVFVQLAFAFGSIIISSFYYLSGHWRIGSIILITIPSLIALFLVFFYIEDTPQFLIKGPINEALKSLNRIGKINYKIKDILQEEDILAVKQNQTVIREFDQIKLVPLDLVRFSSLRFTTICACFISFATYLMYYGSGFVINSMNFDIFASNFIIQLSELIVLIPLYFYIDKIRRKMAGQSIFLIAICLAGILMFIKIPAGCDICFEFTLQIIFAILFRSALAFYFCVFFMYLNELFPIRISGLAVGMASACGSLATLFVELFLKSFQRYSIILLFCGLSFVAFCLVRLLNETRGKTIATDVEEIQELKEKQRLLLPTRNSIIRFSLLKSSIRTDNN